MNLYAVFKNGAEILELVAPSLKEAYYVLIQDMQISFEQGMVITELLKGWCEKAV